MPLERDEGEYAYAGQLLLEGIPPYQFAYNMKLPGTYAAYAAILAILGETPAAIHLGLLIVNAAATLLVVLLARRLFGRWAGFAAGASYALLSTSPSVLGFAGHATHFVVLPALGGILLLLRAAELRSGWRIAASGLLLGLAFLMKQPGVAFVLFGAVYLAWSHPRPKWRAIREIALLLAGAAVPFALTCILLLKAGVFGKFWFWIFSYGSQYGSAVRPLDGLLLLAGVLPSVIGTTAPIWVLAAVGAFCLVRYRRSQAFFPVSFLAFSFLAVSAGLHFRNHYFVLMLPAVSLLVGAAVSITMPGKTTPFLRPALVISAFALALLLGSRFLFRMSPMEAARSVYGANPFPEAIELAHYLRQHSPGNARIAVFGSEPEVYFYSGRHSATGYIYSYGLMEPQKYAREMQQEMALEIEASEPEYFVYVRCPLSWLASKESNRWIFSWADHYLNGQYELVEPQPAGASRQLVVYQRRAILRSND
jgi:Dolichyl-phosphate-mannose-protein mannosyltransferase